MRAINVRRLSATVTTTLFAMVTTLLLPAAVFAQERPYDWGWGMHPMGWMSGMWGIGMMFMMLLFWFLVIGGLILAVRWFLSDQKERRGNDQRWRFCATGMRAVKSTKKSSKPKKET
jgi:uncharacterized membrane protein